MIDRLGVLFFCIVILSLSVPVALVLNSLVRKAFESAGPRRTDNPDGEEETFALLKAIKEAMNKPAALSAEALAVNKRLAEQGDETIALLKVLNENLEHWSLKN